MVHVLNRVLSKIRFIGDFVVVVDQISELNLALVGEATVLLCFSTGKKNGMGLLVFSSKT